MKALFLMVVFGLAIFQLDGAEVQTEPRADDLAGVWMSESAFGPALRGDLTITRKGKMGHAVMVDAARTFPFAGGEVRFAFPGEIGKFRGKFADNAKEIRGFWIQPIAVTKERPAPVGSRQSFATPCVLKRERANVWKGIVRPLDVNFTLFLKIYRSGDGSLVAAFRNHDFNSNGGASIFRVTMEANDVVFTARPDESQPEIRFIASRPAAGGNLTMFWPDIGQKIELTRLSSEKKAADAFPRPPGEAYTYKQPVQTDDGWITANASDVGMDETMLTQVIQKISESDPFAKRPSLIHSILVAHRGKLMLEEYFFGYDREASHDLRSAGKTFASILLGASIRNGVKIGPQTRIYDLLSAMGPFAHPDNRKSQVTLGHLMTHTAGLACNDNDDHSPGNENLMQMQRVQPNWWKFTLDLPVAYDPGTRYAYCSANTNLVGAALTNANKTWLPELFERTLARPLEFGTYHWNLMPDDEGYLGGGAFLRPRDLLKLGQAYLNGGIWNGKRIVESSWVKESTASHMKINPQTTGLDPEEFSNYYIEAEDGYAWHLGQIHAGNRVYKAYEATGNGGQLLIVIPEVDLVVVFTGANYGQGGIWLRWPDQIIGAGIIPAMRLQNRLLENSN